MISIVVKLERMSAQISSGKSSKNIMMKQSNKINIYNTHTKGYAKYARC